MAALLSFVAPEPFVPSRAHCMGGGGGVGGLRIGNVGVVQLVALATTGKLLSSLERCLHRETKRLPGAFVGFHQRLVVSWCIVG